MYFPLEVLKRSFYAFGEHEVAFGADVSGVAGAEPAVFGKCLCGGFGFVVIAAHHGGAFYEDFAFVAYFELQLRHERAYRADYIVDCREASNGGGRFRQAVAYHHVYAYRVEEFHDFRRDGSAGGGEYVAVVHAHGASQRGEYFFVEEAVKRFEPPGSLASEACVIEIAAASDGNGFHDEGFAESGYAGELVLYSGVDFFPEAGAPSTCMWALRFSRPWLFPWDFR